MLELCANLDVDFARIILLDGELDWDLCNRQLVRKKIYETLETITFRIGENGVVGSD